MYGINNINFTIINRVNKATDPKATTALSDSI